MTTLGHEQFRSIVRPQRTGAMLRLSIPPVTTPALRRPRPTSAPTLYDAAIKAGLMAQTAAIIHICRQSEQRKILSIHVVFQIEHTGKSSTGGLRLLPCSVGLLRAQQVTQAALNAWPIEV